MFRCRCGVVLAQNFTHVAYVGPRQQAQKRGRNLLLLLTLLLIPSKDLNNKMKFWYSTIGAWTVWLEERDDTKCIWSLRASIEPYNPLTTKDNSIDSGEFQFSCDLQDRVSGTVSQRFFCNFISPNIPNSPSGEATELCGRYESYH